jgi:hypothetical protein
METKMNIEPWGMIFTGKTEVPGDLEKALSECHFPPPNAHGFCPGRTQASDVRRRQLTPCGTTLQVGVSYLTALFPVRYGLRSKTIDYLEHNKLRFFPVGGEVEETVEHR